MSRVTGLLFAMLAVVTFAPEAHALDIKPPRCYTVVTEDERFVFVMLCPQRPAHEGGDDHDGLRAKYPKSGLYRNDGSRDLLWSVAWYAPKVHLASDGIHLV